MRTLLVYVMERRMFLCPYDNTYWPESKENFIISNIDEEAMLCHTAPFSSSAERRSSAVSNSTNPNPLNLLGTQEITRNHKETAETAETCTDHCAWSEEYFSVDSSEIPKSIKHNCATINQVYVPICFSIPHEMDGRDLHAFRRWVRMLHRSDKYSRNVPLK